MSDYDHAAVTRAERRRRAGPCDAERAFWPKFTLGEVAKHVSLKDGWIVIYERVFDITAFAITHPGFHNAGQVSTALAITRNLGKDCTEEFVSIHSATAWAQLHDFQIGVVLRDADLAPRGPVSLEDVDVVPPLLMNSALFSIPPIKKSQMPPKIMTVVIPPPIECQAERRLERR